MFIFFSSMFTSDALTDASLVFSLLFTFIFWIGLFCCFSIVIDNLLVGFFAILLFIAAFGYIALTDEFMGYLYGHNNLWELIEHYLIMFVDEG